MAVNGSKIWPRSEHAFLFSPLLSSLLSSSSPPVSSRSRVEVVLWVSCPGGAVGVVSWWCCGCRPVVVLSCQTGKGTGRRAEPYGAAESGQCPHIWLYEFKDLTFERQVILTLCIHFSSVFLRLKRDFFFGGGEWVQNFASQ